MTLASTRQCVIHADGLALQGRMLTGATTAGAVVAPPHPLYGGSLSNPVVQATATGLCDAGFSALMFNYRGTEDSEGVATDSLEAATADYAAALAQLRAQVSGPTLAAGYSFGAGTALLTTRDDAQLLGMVLVAPPLGMLRSDDLTAYRGRLLVIVGDDDDFAPIGDLRARLSAHTSCTLEVLPGVDHFFHFGGLAALRKLVREHVTAWL